MTTPWPGAITGLLAQGTVGDGALSTRAHVFVIVVTIASIAFIVRLVRSHKLRTKYSLLWITVAVLLATVAVFPGLLARLSDAAGVYYPPATFLILSVGFLFIIVVHFSWESSRAEERIRTLAEDLALLQAAHDATVDALRSGRTPPARIVTGGPPAEDPASRPAAEGDAGEGPPEGTGPR
jgi:hypothetical protein